MQQPTLAALKAGDAAPPFTAPASLAGKPFTYSLKESLAKGPVVVYFYPSAYTSGCNVQAHEFSTKTEQFAAAGASVVGVSLDSIERLNAFSADPAYCAGKLAVASDAEGRIARSFGLRVSDELSDQEPYGLSTPSRVARSHVLPRPRPGTRCGASLG